jgi:hypothetical protein
VHDLTDEDPGSSIFGMSKAPAQKNEDFFKQAKQQLSNDNDSHKKKDDAMKKKELLKSVF